MLKERESVGGEEEKKGGAGELKQHKICLEPPNLIYTTNRERERGKRGEGKKKRNGGGEKRGKE